MYRDSDITSGIFIDHKTVHKNINLLTNQQLYAQRSLSSDL